MQSHHLLLLLLLWSSIAFAGDDPSHKIVGRWSADARLFDRDIRSQTTPLESELVFAEDLSLSGRVGQAVLPPTKPYSATAKRLEYRFVLDQPVSGHVALAKSHLIVIVTIDVRGDLDADFHLKSRFGFDISMRVGHFDAKRITP